jgi:outer membrane protein
MKKFLQRCSVIFSSILLFSSVYADDLWTVYQQAVVNDPTLMQADALRKANREALPQSASALLPSLNGAADTQSIHFSQPQTLNSGNGFVLQSAALNAHGYSLTLTQPLFNFQNWMQVRAASATSKQADATYNAALQDLIVRTATAYFNVLQAQDTLAYTNAQKKAVDDQLKQIHARYQVGMATMTDVYQAQANLDSLVAQSIAAQNNVANSFEGLKQITNRNYFSLDNLREPFPLISPQPDSAQTWIKSGECHNWSLLADHYASLSAKENIRVNYAGHFPTLNAVGTYQRGNNNELGFGPTGAQWKSTAGLQMSVPIFQGGLVVSKTRQAQDQYLAAADQMETTHRKVILQAQESFNNVISGISKIKADRATVISAQSALDSTNAGYKAGTKTILDVLSSVQNLYQAKASLSADQYNYLISTLTLKQAAGSLNAQDVLAINRWLNHVT